ncbi:MAG TPA: permease prefix domain 1-containing protein, partial [Gemmatimonadaceae bacterium]|nr:permease prefix domain 1-containing protein [Gemmatimonadaceae bacterium]
MRWIYWRGRSTGDFSEEVDSHLAMETERLVRSGMTPEQAAFSARRAFGNTTVARERFREARPAQWLEALVQDMYFGLRFMRRNPWFTLVAALTLALGIGASTAVFSVVKSALLDPWPYAASDRIVTTRGEFPKLGQRSFDLWSVAEFGDLRARTDIFDYVIAGMGRSVSLVQDTYAERIKGAQMTADAFQMLGVKPLLGR